MFRRISILISAALVLASCGSMQENAGSFIPFKEASLAGMVYGADNRPVRGARILLDNTVEAQTDINGRFVTAPIPSGRHDFLITKEGHEPQMISVEFTDRLQVLYVRLISLDYLLERAEAQIDQENLDQAETLLERAARIQPDDPALVMLKLVVAVKQDDRESMAEPSRMLHDRTRPAQP